MKTNRFLLAAGVSLALTFTLSCSSDDKNDDGGGSSSSGTTYGSLTHEGKTYRTVAIGSQTWMADNMNHNANGSKCYGDSDANCTKYGRLYDWETAKTVCPNDWRLPSEADFTALANSVGGLATAGIKLKTKSDWNTAGPAGAVGKDDYGFSGLPGGGYIPGDGFANINNYGYWWSSDEDSGTNNGAKLLKLDYYETYALIDTYTKESMYSVRCLKN